MTNTVANMTALEMAEKFKWATVIVHFGYGHCTVEGQTRILQGGPGEAVWVGNVCLHLDTMVCVEECDGWAKVNVFQTHQVCQAKAA